MNTTPGPRDDAQQRHADAFSAMVDAARARREAAAGGDPNAAADAPAPPLVRLETQPDHLLIHLDQGPLRLTDVATAVLAGSLLVLCGGGMFFWLASGDSKQLVPIALMIGGIGFFSTAWQFLRVRAPITFRLDAGGFAFERRIGPLQWKMEQRFERGEVDYLYVGISRMAIDDRETVFDLIAVSPPGASGGSRRRDGRLRESIVESRNREELEWIAARLRRDLNIPPPPTDFWIAPARGWPLSVLMKRKRMQE